MSNNQIIINNLSKVYKNGFQALKTVNLNIKKGEIFAMLGPNGAGKTTLISIICGIVKPSSGKVTVDGFDIIDDYRETRSRIGLVPQELTLEQFETVFNNVSYSRVLYGKKPDPKHIEKILLWFLIASIKYPQSKYLFYQLYLAWIQHYYPPFFQLL